MVFFEVAYHLQGVRIPYGIPRYNYTFLLLNPVSLRQDVDCFLLCGFPVFPGGGLPYETDGDARRKF